VKTIIKERKTELGKILTDIRLEADLTIEEASDQVGVSTAEINAYELGKTNPSYKSLQKVLTGYGYEIEIVKK